jgi:hypothetical protein
VDGDPEAAPPGDALRPARTLVDLASSPRWRGAAARRGRSCSSALVGTSLGAAAGAQAFLAFTTGPRSSAGNLSARAWAASPPARSRAVRGWSAQRHVEPISGLRAGGRRGPGRRLRRAGRHPSRGRGAMARRTLPGARPGPARGTRSWKGTGPRGQSLPQASACCTPFMRSLGGYASGRPPPLPALSRALSPTRSPRPGTGPSAALGSMPPGERSGTAPAPPGRAPDRAGGPLRWRRPARRVRFQDLRRRCPCIQGARLERARAGASSSVLSVRLSWSRRRAADGSSANWNRARSSREITPCRTRASKSTISFQKADP